ncbi:hypothetical protein M9458_001623, partial [Cirrhinus mrigala]
ISQVLTERAIGMLTAGMSTRAFARELNVSGQMLTFDGIWHFGEVFSSWMNPGFHCTGQMADSIGLLMSTLWI